MSKYDHEDSKDILLRTKSVDVTYRKK